MNSRFLMQSAGTLRPPHASAATARLQLTSLVDMMVILVVFLLKSFSVEGQLVTPAADLDLPISSAESQVQPGLTIEISPEMIRIDGRHQVATADVARDDETARAVLDASLADIAAIYDAPSVTIHCDRRVDFRILGRVLRACGGEGLEDVSLLVLEATS